MSALSDLQVVIMCVIGIGLPMLGYLYEEYKKRNRSIVRLYSDTLYVSFGILDLIKLYNFINPQYPNLANMFKSTGVYGSNTDYNITRINGFKIIYAKHSYDDFLYANMDIMDYINAYGLTSNNKIMLSGIRALNMIYLNFLCKNKMGLGFYYHVHDSTFEKIKHIDDFIKTFRMD